MKKNTMFATRILAAALAVTLSASSFPVIAKAEVQSDGNKQSVERSVKANGETTENVGAFDKKDIATLFNEQKFTVSNPEQVKAEYNRDAEGLLVSGDSKEVANSVFTFAEEFDFSNGTIGRVDVDAVSAKGSNATIQFYLDDSETPFAQVTPAVQKRAKKWLTKVLTTSVRDQKITGKHKITFKLVPSEKEQTTGMALRSVTFAKSTLPTVYFNIDETQGSIDAMNHDQAHDTECYGDMKLEIPEGYTCEFASDKGKTDNIKSETYKLDYVRGRGNSTWGNSKNPYKIKLEKKADLFNMGKNKHWVLLADYFDPSHIRNKITYWMGQKLGMPFTPQGVYVDVVMNGQYYGSYMLCEHVRVGKSRVDIDDLEEDDASKAATDEPTITGGYLLGMSPYNDDDGKIIRTRRDANFLIESPSFEDYENEAQYNYIKNYIQDTEDAIYGKNFKKGDKSYWDYMDIPSAVNYYWIQEFSMNGDAFGSTSTYLYKPRNGKLFWGPLWDFDYVAWGNNEYGEYNCEGWTQNGSTWYEKMFRDPTFADAVIKRWPEIKAVMEEASRDGGQIDKYAEEIRSSMKYNSYLFGNNYDADENDKTFQDSVDQLKNWIKARTKWVDENVKTLKLHYYKVRFLNGKKVLSVQNVAEGDNVKFPNPGKKKGYILKGWYAKNGKYSYRVDEDTAVYENMTITAKWIRKDKVKPVKAIILGYNEKATTYWENGPEVEEGDADTINIPYRVIGGVSGTNKLVWKSSNPKVGKMTGDGEMSILGVGDTRITASTKDGKVKASCKIHVASSEDEDVACDGFDLNKLEVKIKKGGYTVLSPTLFPSNNTEDVDMVYYCSDPAVRLEQIGNKCIVKGVKDGEAQVIAVASTMEVGNVIKTCKVKVGTAAQRVIKPGSRVVSGGIAYKVTSVTLKGGTVKVIGISNAKKTRLNIPKTITISQKKYAVTAVGAKAFKGNKKLRSAVIGANVRYIGDKAFYGCKKLRSVTFKNKKVKVGKQVFVKTKVPRKYKKASK